MTDTADLTSRLAEAARSAVEKRRAAIQDGAGNLNGITIEIEVSNAGATLDVLSHLSWKSVLREARTAR